LDSVKPDNSTVESCLKLLIRIARTSTKVARQLANDSYLIEVLFVNFLPSSNGSNQFYGQPQILFLKLIRVLVCQHLDIAKSLSKGVLIVRLQQYLFLQDNKVCVYAFICVGHFKHRIFLYRSRWFAFRSSHCASCAVYCSWESWIGIFSGG